MTAISPAAAKAPPAPEASSKASGESRWTEEQRLAIESCGTNVLVSASAGTGKTAVLVERVIRRVLGENEPADVDRMLVVTFTEAAAAEMRERVLRALLRRAAEDPADDRVQRQLALLPRAHISTVHSFCLSLIREDFHRLGLDPELRVMDEHEAGLLRIEVLDRILEARYAAEDAGFLDLVDRYAGDRGDEPLRQLVLDLHSYARGLPDSASWLRAAAAAFDVPPGTGLMQTPWGKELALAVQGTAEYIVGVLDEALRCCDRPGGPGDYRDTLAADRAAFAAIAGAAAAGDWDGLVEAAGSPYKARLPQSKGSDATVRAEARGRREDAWKALGRLQTVVRPESELLDQLRGVKDQMAVLTGLVIELDESAREQRASRGMLDFADLEFYALNLLTAPGGAVARELRRRFVEVYVDEYQDINGVQHALLDLLSHGNLFCIGDVKQSIYRFRGTDPGYFRRKKGEYLQLKPGQDASGQAPAAGVWIGLGRNFRSRQVVVDAVNFVFAQLMACTVAETAYGPEDVLRKGFDYSQAPEPDVPVEVYVLERAPMGAAAGGAPPGGQGAGSGQGSGGETEGPEEDEGGPGPDGVREEDQATLNEIEREAELVASRITRMVQGDGGAGPEFSVYDSRAGGYRPVSYRDIAVLLRAIRGRANRYLETFARLVIPVRAELSTGYFSAIEVETMLALLRVIDNPRQDIPLAAVLRSPVVGLNERELAAVRAAAMAKPYYDAVVAAAASTAGGGSGAAGGGGGARIGPETAGRISGFLERLSGWRTAARRGPLSELVWTLLRETSYLGFAGGLPGGAQRQANLLALHDRAREFDRFSRQGLGRFLRFVEQLHDNQSDLGAVSDPGEGADSVLLTSIHKSKGLEFPVVFLPDLGRRFRRGEPADVLWHSKVGLGPVFADRDKGVKYQTVAWHAVDALRAREDTAEEMRLLYVGMTRARERLVLSGSTRKLETRLHSWGATARPDVEKLPDAVLRTDATYLDWVCRALARHPGGAMLRGMGGEAAVREEPSKWSINLVPAGERAWDSLFPGRDAGAPAEAGSGQAGKAPGLVPAPGETEALADDEFARIIRLHPVRDVDPETVAAFERTAGWRYAAPLRARIPAKQSVSRISRQLSNLAPAMEDADPVRGYDPAAVAPAGLRGPELRPWARRRAPDAAQLGTLAHLVLRHVDLALPPGAESLRRQGVNMERRGLLAPGESELVDWDALAWFFATPLGEMLGRERAHVRREVSFTVAVPATEVVPWLLRRHGEDGSEAAGGAAGGGPDRRRPCGASGGAPDGGLAGELLLVQGMVDCLVDLPGGPALVDFKTDRVTPEQLAARSEAYFPQVALYARAIRESLDAPVREAWLVFLHTRACVPVPVS